MLVLRPSPLPSRRGLALGLSLALAVPAGMTSRPQTAAAAAAIVAPDEDAALAEARTLYDDGKARFDTFDYEGAVELWTRAYAKLPNDASGVRNAMVYNIATAQEKAYEVDKDLQHLRQAVLLLEQYVKNYKAIYQRTPETKLEVDKAEARIATLKERIAKAEKGDDATPPPTATPPPAQFGGAAVDGISWTTGHTPPPDPELQAKNRQLAAENEKTDHMLIASYVCLGVGGVFVLGGGGALFGGTQANNSEADSGRGAVGAGYGTLAFGVASLGAGITLLAIGLGRRKRAQQGLVVAPLVGPRFAGAGLNMRF